MAKKSTKIEISLTDFVDFVCKSGTAKLTKVRQIKERDDYSPKTDFYKALREGVIENHETGGSRNDLGEILQNVTDEKKKENYADALAGYKKFWGRKDIKWLKPPAKHWSLGEIDIRVNPELGLEYDGNFYIIKMYLKADKLSKDRVTQILSLLEDQLRSKVESEVIFCVLDVRNSKLYCNDSKNKSLMTLLKGEAISFETIWKGLPEPTKP